MWGCLRLLVAFICVVVFFVFVVPAETPAELAGAGALAIVLALAMAWCLRPYTKDSDWEKDTRHNGFAGFVILFLVVVPMFIGCANLIRAAIAWFGG